MNFEIFTTMKKLFIASLIFFAAAAVFFLFVILRGSNIVSTRNVSILVDGPVSAEAGKALSLKIIIENKNNTALESADILIEYPEGTRTAKNLEEELTRFRSSLGTIAPRETEDSPSPKCLLLKIRLSRAASRIRCCSMASSVIPSRRSCSRR